MAQTDETEAFLKTLKPEKDIPFSTVIKIISGKDVLPMTDSPEDKQLLNDLKTAVIEAGKNASRDNKTCFIPRNWKIVSIHDMKVNLKYEFNTDSKGMYQKEAILGEGTI